MFAKLFEGFGGVQKLFLFAGLTVALAGVRSGFTFQNRTLFVGIALLATGFAGHYLPDVRSHELYTGDSSTRITDWGRAPDDFLLWHIRRSLLVCVLGKLVP